MNCMKCGRETRDENVFCPDCLLEMGKYPILPGTVVQLPRRKESTVPKKITKRHVPTPEEQIVSLRKWVVSLILILLLCICAIALMVKPTLHYVTHSHFEIGQNYSTVTTTPKASE